MKTSIFTLITLILLSSCSVVKKNGYYQSRSYKPSKKLNIQFGSKKDNSSGRNKAEHLTSQRVPTMSTLTLDLSPKEGNAKLELNILPFKVESSVSEINISIPTTVTHRPLQFKQSPRKHAPEIIRMQSSDEEEEEDLLNVLTIFIAILAVIGLATTTLTIIGYALTLIPFILFFLLVIRSKERSRSYRTTMFGLFSFSMLLVSFAVLADSSVSLIASIAAGSFFIFFFAFIILLILGLVFYKREKKELQKEKESTDSTN